MLGPTAIVLKPENFDDIRYWTFASEEVLKENFDDSVLEGELYYVVFTRHPKTGHPRWMVYGEASFEEEWRFKNPPKSNRWNRIERKF